MCLSSLFTEFNLDFYTEVQDLSYLSNSLASSSKSTTKLSKKYSKLNERICELIEDFSLVSFETLAVEDKRSMFRLLRVLDKALGWIYVTGEEKDEDEIEDEWNQNQTQGDGERGSSNPIDPTRLNHPKPSTESNKSSRGAPAETLFSTTDRGEPLGWGSALEVQERYVDYKDEFDEIENQEIQKIRDQELERRIYQEGGKFVREERERKEREEKESATSEGKSTERIK